jgi:hypothetical protein
MRKKEDKNKLIINDLNLFNFGSVGRNETSQNMAKEKFTTSKKWISFGEKDATPSELIRLYQNSDGLHSALIRKSADMIAGNGFEYNASYEEFLKNPYGTQTGDEIAYKIGFDISLHGGAYIQIVWSQDRKSIAKMEYVPYDKVRIAVPEDKEYDCEIEGFYVSRDFEKHTRPENTPVFVHAFSQEEEDKLNHPTQLYYTKLYTPGLDYYSLPTYFPAINWIKLSYEISTFHLKCAQNSYLPNLIVSIPNMYDEVIREKMSAEIKARSGTDNAGETVVLYGDSPEKMPKFDVIDPMISDKKFSTTMTQMNENIYVAHGANSNLAGVAVSGKLGSSSEILEAYSMYQATRISPLQKKVEDIFTKFGQINGCTGELKLKQYSPFPQVIDDSENARIVNTINSLPPLIATKILDAMSQDEIRNLIGLKSVSTNNITTGTTQTTITE